MNKEIINAIESTKSVEELKETAIKKGYILSDRDIKNFYDMYHNNGKINENELDNVSGGGCQTYSEDEPYRLIVTDFNRCNGFKFGPGYEKMSETCDHCLHSITGAGTFADEMVMYCRLRTKNNDLYK